jgi:hypothetical protein
VYLRTPHLIHRCSQAIDAFLDYSTDDHEVTCAAYKQAILDGTAEAIKALDGAVDKAFRNASLRLHADRGGQCTRKKAKYERIMEAKSVIKADLAEHLELIEKREQREKRGTKRRIELVRVGTD